MCSFALYAMRDVTLLDVSLKLATPGLQMEDQVADDNDVPASVQDDPILSRPLQKGLMEDWLGTGIYQELPLYRGKVRGVSQKRLKGKEKSSGVHNISRYLGVACGNVKFAVRVTDTTPGGKSVGDFPKNMITCQVANLFVFLLIRKQYRTQIFFQTLIVRVYILRGIQLKSMDIGGSSDPYLVLKHGPGLSSSIVDKKR